MDSQYSPTHVVHSRHYNTRMMANTPDSMSQVLNINVKQFDFELDNSANKSSIDFILDQIQTKSTKQSEGNRASSQNPNRQRTNSNAKKPKKKLDDRTNLVSLNQACFVDNVSRQSSIRSLISNVESNKPTKATNDKPLAKPNAAVMSPTYKEAVAKVVNGLSSKQPVIIYNNNINAESQASGNSFTKVKDLKARGNY